MDDWKQKFAVPKRLLGYQKCIWEETLEIQPNQIDIWKGCPDFVPSKAIIEALTEVSTNGNALLHQYTRGCGHPRLVSALSKLYSTLTNREIDPNNDVLVTVGVHGAIYNTIFGNITNGDEVIIIEPFSDYYDATVRSAGGVPVFVPLRLKENLKNASSDEWVLDPLELASAFNGKTKIIILDTPNVHLGKVYTRAELEEISNLCKKWNVLCVAIEADEFLVHDSETKYARLATLPDMQQRTISIGSSDSTFFLKGWKVGWAYGPSHLIKNSQISHLNSVYVCTTGLQEALAIVIEKEMQLLDSEIGYFKTVVRDLAIKKKILNTMLYSTGMNIILPKSGVFMVAEWTPLEHKIISNLKMELPNNFDFVKWFLSNSGIQVVPLSMFFSDSHAPIAKKMVRFCFNKKHETLLKAKDMIEAFAVKLN
ncbi:hypothetical protein FQR65_LT10428 [Abscondita terminalis]|nr:hypothetical protein FQR65_LT10428 [Abscondita terminalis]